MVTYDDYLQTCYDMMDQNAPQYSAFITRVGNIAYRRAMRYFGRQFEERTKIAYTVSGQQYYQLPIDYAFMKTVKVLVGTYSYDTEEVRSQKRWDELNRITNISNTKPTHHFIRLNSGIGGDELGLWPTPSYGDGTSANSNPITLVYEAVPSDVVQAAFSSSTGSLTNGSAVLTDTAGNFTTSLVGRYFNAQPPIGDGQYYKINQWISATSVGIQNYYEGPTFTNAAYQIQDLFGLAEEAQMIPVYFTLWHYFKMRRSPELAEEYRKDHERELKMAMDQESNKSRNNVIRRSKNYNNLMNLDYPANFPSAGITS